MNRLSANLLELARKRWARWTKALVAAWLIGWLGMWLAEQSRYMGHADEDHPIPPPTYPIVNFLVRQPALKTGESLAQLSFDFPQMARPPRSTDEVVIVFIDDRTQELLEKGSVQNQVLNRSLHAQLLRRLKADGARAVFFDIIFAGGRDEANTEADEDLAAAMREFGNVFIGGGIDHAFREGRSHNEVITPPQPLFRKAGASWGLLVFRPMDSDYGIRAIYTGTDRVPSLSWRAAEKMGATLPTDAEGRRQVRWLSYYKRPGVFANVNYAEALDPKGIPPETFKDKVVFVGGRSSIARINEGKDDFRTPYTRLPMSGQFAPGVEIHATAFLNLMRGEFLTRVPWPLEGRLFFWFGFLLALVLIPQRPWLVILVGVMAAVAVTAAAFTGVYGYRVWTVWMIPALIQPLLIVVANYVLEGRRRAAIIKAFSMYLSPELANQAAAEEIDLKPGGKVVEGTIMFTDLEGFTSLSEELDDPARLSKILAIYFTQSTGHVLELKGTIAKFIGDAVLAVWGAPLPNVQHKADAVRSAWRLHKDSEIVIDGKPLIVRGKKVRTRVGIHTGQILAGNLGSEKRFDWTVVGDPVNLAARLESLNKHLGTNVLISDDVFRGMGDDFTTRRLGAFIMKGKVAPLTIHEVLGEIGVDAVPDWLPDFNAAVAAFEKGDASAAGAAFEKVIAARGGYDGPSRFYLDELARRATEPAEWRAEVEMHEK